MRIFFYLYLCVLKQFLLFLSILLSYRNVQSQNFRFENNAKQISIYNKISALQLQAASAEIYADVLRDPTNLSNIHLANYIDFYELFFNEDPQKFAQQKPNLSKRINLIAKLPNTNPYKLYSQGVQYFQWALIKLKFKDYFSAAQDLRNSYLLLVENKNKFPSFHQQQVYIGAIETVVGTIPSKYRWLASVLGLKGNIKTGMAKVENSMLSKNKQYPMDVLFLNVYLKQYFAHQPIQAWELLQKHQAQCANNRLLAFMVANIALNQNKANEALAALSENKTKSGFLEIPMLDYEMGVAYIYKIDAKCKPALLQFIKNNKGKFYLKDAYYKLSMYSYMQGNIAEAEQFRMKINTVGNTETDADKSAQQFFESKTYSTPALIKVRYLFDGGFFAEAQNTMKTISLVSLKTELQKIEYYYRQGRIFQQTKQYTEAIAAYNQTISLGKNQTAYYAARAALESGIIFETTNNKSKAAVAYKQCLAIDNHDYKTSLDQQAKAGLQRIDR
jgi:hypothetical protein